MYPDDCVQSITDSSNWWMPNNAGDLCRGALVIAFVPHFDQVPYSFEPVGRTQATEHTHADIRVAPLKVDQPLKQVPLPVAAMPLYRGEVWAAFRAKGRPCLVIAEQCPAVDKSLVRGMPKFLTAPTVLVAPYYGADRDGSRAGYNPDFVERIRHCEYPQFMWDMLPVDGGPKVSILRLDQLQPMGTYYHSYKLTGFKLSDSALEILDDLIHWLLWGGFPEDSDLLAYRELVQEFLP